MSDPISPNSREPLDAGMLELFRGELDAHVPSLLEGLSSSTHSFEQLQNLMRAAHSIKGAARIVGLDHEADLAHEMESCFQFSVGKNVIAEDRLQVLQEAADYFAQMMQTPLEEVEHWLNLHCDEATEMTAKLKDDAALDSSFPDAVVAHTNTNPATDPVAVPVSATPEPVQEPLDLDMLEMFRMEVEGHAASLNDGLLALESNPRDAEKLQSLMRAAHSIKGAARIVGIDMGVKIAHEMEDCFVSAGNGSIELKAEHIDLLLRAVDTFVQLADCPPENATQWLIERNTELVALCQSLVRLAKAGSIAETAHAAPSTQSVQPQRKSEIRTVPAMEPLDESMLELFHMEVEGHTASLNEGLLALEQSSNVKPALQSLMRAAHSIKGAARIVGIELGVKLAHAMEDWFVAAQNDKVSLEPAQIDLLLKGVDFFVQLSAAATSAAQAQEWMTQHYFEVDELATVLTTLVSSGGITPVPVSPSSTPKIVQSMTSSSSPSSANLDAGSTLGTAVTGRMSPTQTTTGTMTPGSSKSGSGKVVRVAAENLNRLLGLAGESLVETRWHTRFSESLLRLKRQQFRLTASLRQLRRNLDGVGIPSNVESPLLDAERRAAECSRLIVERLSEFERFTHRADILSQRLYHEAVGSRMRPFDDGVQGFPRLVRDLSRQLGKRVQLLIEGRNTEVDRDVLERLEAPLNHLVRNALDHGLETPDERVRSGKDPMGTLKIEARHRAGMLFISVSEDGRGVSLDRVKARILDKKLAAPDMLEKMTETEILEFLFLPGFSTAKALTDVSGRGVGLDVVQNMVQESAGVVRIVTKVGQGTSFNLQLPITLSVLRVLLVDVQGEPYAFPLSRIEKLLAFDASELKSLDNRQFVTIDGENIGIVSATQVLDRGEDAPTQGTLNAVVIGDRNNRYGLVVNRFLGEYELVVRPLDARLGKVPAVSSVSVLEDGTPCTILDVEDVVRITDGILKGEKLRKVGGELNAESKRRKRVLVVDDSFTVRETERKLLERHGYDVKIAVDGMDGWNAVRSAPFDLVVSDVDMPRMNGIEFVRLIKGDDRLRVIPVVIVSYKDREEDRLRGMDAGANCYLTKGSFQDHTFIQAISDLIGSGEELLAGV